MFSPGGIRLFARSYGSCPPRGAAVDHGAHQRFPRRSPRRRSPCCPCARRTPASAPICRRPVTSAAGRRRSGLARAPGTAAGGRRRRGAGDEGDAPRRGPYRPGMGDLRRPRRWPFAPSAPRAVRSVPDGALGHLGLGRRVPHGRVVHLGQFERLPDRRGRIRWPASLIRVLPTGFISAGSFRYISDINCIRSKSAARLTERRSRTCQAAQGAEAARRGLQRPRIPSRGRRAQALTSTSTSA